jgi:hypothetical protein
MIAPAAKGVLSDNGELRREWEKGIYVIDTPRTQAALGWVGGEGISLPDVQVAVSTRNASVVVQSLDNVPINQSKNILISLGARSELEAPFRMPFRSELVTGQLHIRAPNGLKLYTRSILDKYRELPVIYEHGQYVIRLDKGLRSYWLFLRSQPPQ